LCNVMLTLAHKTPELIEATDHGFLSVFPVLVELCMKEQIPDKKERDDFAAKMTAETRNPDYHWYSDMYINL
jgi:hypothetical protein